MTTGNSIVDGYHVGADATFTFNQGSLNITLWNTQNQISDANQGIDGISFDLSKSLNNAKMSVTATEGSINSLGQVTTQTAKNSEWDFGSYYGATDISDGFFGTNSDDSIIPLQNSYSSADWSIKGNDWNNPFLVGPVTFTITDSSLTSLTSLSDVEFEFAGNSCGDPSVHGVLTPEPVSFALTGTGLALVLGGMLRRRKAMAERA